MPVYHYAIYGLTVASDMPLPGVPAATVDREAGSLPGVRVATLDARPQATPARAGCLAASPERVVLWHPNAGFLIADGGHTLSVYPEGPLLPSLVLGQGLAAILLQRGTLVLHGSAVVIGGGALAFVGDKGAGKSTAAAALVQAGHTLLSDDLLPLVGERPPRVAPGYGFVKLTDEAARQLSPAAGALEGTSKRTLMTRPSGGAVPLRAVCDLGFGPHLGATRLEGRRAFEVIARHAYAGALAPAVGRAGGHLASCAALATRVPVLRLERPRDLGALEAFVRLAETLVR